MAFINMNGCIYTRKENCLDFSCFIWNKFQEINSCPYDPGQQSCTKDSLWFDKAGKLWRFSDVTEYDQIIWLFCLMDSISGLLLSRHVLALTWAFFLHIVLESSKFFLVIECVFRIKQEIISCVTWCKTNRTTSCTSYCCMNISSFHDITWPVITSAVILHEMGTKIASCFLFFILKNQFIFILLY